MEHGDHKFHVLLLVLPTITRAGVDIEARVLLSYITTSDGPIQYKAESFTSLRDVYQA